MMERRLTCHIISALCDKIEYLTMDQESMNEKLRSVEDKLYAIRSKFKELKREGNALKRYNSRLVFNSFVSDLTDVPKKDAHSQARVQQIYRDFSSSSIKGKMYDFSGDQDPNSKINIYDDN
jgi:predicted nuclease with TOPRIM domain